MVTSYPVGSSKELLSDDHHRLRLSRNPNVQKMAAILTEPARDMGTTVYTDIHAPQIVRLDPRCWYLY